MFPFNDLFEDASGIEDLLRQLTPGQQAAFALSVIAEAEASGTGSPEEIERLRALAMLAGDSDPEDFAIAREYLKEAGAANEPWLVGTAVQLTLFAPAEKPSPAPLKTENADLAEAFALFDERVRRGEVAGETVYSIVDVIAVLTDSDRPRKYWDDLKRKLIAEGRDVSENIGHIPMLDATGKRRQQADVGTRETIFRLIQSIPSPRAEPIKLWMAELGEGRAKTLEQREARRRQRVDSTARRLGHSEKWAEARLDSMVNRASFMDALSEAVGKHWDGYLPINATNALYRGLFKRDSKTIRADLGAPPRSNVRDQINRIALHYIAIAEALAEGQFAQYDYDIPRSVALEIVREVAKMVGVSVEALEQSIGRDILTNQPLPPRLLE